MNGRPRLASPSDVTGPARHPEYNADNHGCGIVHLGCGAFHRAHQAVYTDDALAASGGDWRITAVSLRGTEAADALNPQNGLYTLVERGPDGTSGRIVASIAHVIAASREPIATLGAMTNPATRIVSLTVTEKAYGIDRVEMDADPDHPAVAADLANPRAPNGVLGLIAEALRLRRENGIIPFTVLCCDNLPDNGALLRAGVTGFMRRTSPGLLPWLQEHTAFPSTMVDRITPAATGTTLADAARLTGCTDLAAVETEPFTQWVIEDHFTDGRPDWEAGGALFVKNVQPYELMKLRMLNGAHSMLAYSGFLTGRAYVREVMADPDHARLVNRHMRAAAATLPRLAAIDPGCYRADLLERFRNPAIAHQTYQIAMDGTQKLPQRILAPAAEALASGDSIQSFAFAVAAWMRYCTGRSDDGIPYALRDPRESEIREAVAGAATTAGISGALHGLRGLFDDVLRTDAHWRSAVDAALGRMLTHGMAGAIRQEAADMSA